MAKSFAIQFDRNEVDIIIAALEQKRDKLAGYLDAQDERVLLALLQRFYAEREWIEECRQQDAN
jgi:hypothetical protein